VDARGALHVARPRQKGEQKKQFIHWLINYKWFNGCSWGNFSRMVAPKG
jgi:hypothetical protein